MRRRTYVDVSGSDCRLGRSDLSSASIVFVPSHVSNQPILAFSVVLLGFAVLWGVSFIAWMSYCYEETLYNPANFTACKSSIMFALGLGPLACFVLHTSPWLWALRVRLPMANRFLSDWVLPVGLLGAGIGFNRYLPAAARNAAARPRASQRRSETGISPTAIGTARLPPQPLRAF